MWLTIVIDILARIHDNRVPLAREYSERIHCQGTGCHAIGFDNSHEMFVEREIKGRKAGSINDAEASLTSVALASRPFG